jgi:FtsP/CotA-like multicopper oxidase with cupredoxin domain
VRDGVLDVRLVARRGAWRPDLGVDSTVTVETFAEEGGAPRIPGPLLRAASGTEIEMTLRNDLDSTLVVSGLRAGAFADDTVHVAAGATRTLRFRAGAPGTYLYWGTTTRAPIRDRPLRDSQLTGAFVVDPAGVRPDTAERIFVMTVIDYVPTDTARNTRKEDIWDLAINGRSWPHTEALRHPVGARVRWRWVNGSYLPHPMHLHGFHFTVTARGEGNRDSVYTPVQTRTVVTEYMMAGGTFAMEWTPTRAGQWLMHCHMLPHVSPFPERPDSVRAHEAHDPAQHPLRAMSGLVLGVTTYHRPGTASAPSPPPTRTLRLLAQQAGDGRNARRGYVLQRGAEPARDSVPVPGTPLLLTRGETAAITVVNRMREPTAVHWHGMEIESVFDGVPGWGSTPTQVAPMIAPGDSFAVTMTPPRAGTFIYHTHIDEGMQLRTGMYAPLLVLEPGARHDPERDHVFVLGMAVEGDSARFAVDGRSAPAPRTLRAGVPHRLRIINILGAPGAVVELTADSAMLAWEPLAKDGADLPPSQRGRRPSTLRRLGPGETYDFVWTPARPMRATLRFLVEGSVLTQPIMVR